MQEFCVNEFVFVFVQLVAAPTAGRGPIGEKSSAAVAVSDDDIERQLAQLKAL